MITTTIEDTFVRASNGDRLPTRMWIPRRPRRAVVALHGLVTHAGWFAQLAQLLLEREVALIAPDRRGNGAAKHLPHAGDIGILISDIAAVVGAAREVCEDLTLFSWCGSVNVAVPAATHVPVHRVLLASPGLVPRPEMSARFRAQEPVAGFLPIHFDPATDFTDDAGVQTMIRNDTLYLRHIALEVRDAWRELNPIARAALGTLAMPTRCVLTRIDRMIDIPATVAQLGDIPVDWVPGGHGFVVEPAGARRVAELLADWSDT